MSDDREKADAEHATHSDAVDVAPEPKLDKHGLPLVPQPSDHKDDPLNWSFGLKLSVLLQISFLALLGPMSAAVINPAFVPLGKDFGISPVEASYELTVFTVFAGIGPLLINPLANTYGRRPVYIFGNLVAAVTNIAAGHCTTWSGILATRVFNGIGAGCVIAIGPATICDVFFLHERGLFMGVYTFFLTNGPHLASLVGGFIAEELGWRWSFNIPAYIQFGVFAINFFCLPETLYTRQTTESPDTPYSESSYLDLILFRAKHRPERKVHLIDFTRPFMMLRYVTVIVPAVYYMTSFTYGSILFAATGSVIFRESYGFNVAQTGMILSIPLLVGCLIGEANAGWFTDWLVYSHSKRHGGKRIPEPRLNALWIALLLPIGTIIQGVCITHSATVGWIGNAFGMGIASLGLQVATTVVYAYCTDCYKPQSAEISAVLNLFRQVYGALVEFYAIPLAEEIQYQYAWLVFAMINVALLIPMFGLRAYGDKIRAKTWQSPPTFHNDI